MSEHRDPTSDLDGASPTSQVEMPAITVSGGFLDSVELVEGASASLVVALGELDGSKAKVIVPFVAVNVAGSKLSDEQQRPLMDALVTLEDAVYLISDLGAEIRTALNELAQLNAGPVKLEEQRLGTLRELVSQALGTLGECKDIVEGLEHENSAFDIPGYTAAKTPPPLLET